MSLPPPIEKSHSASTPEINMVTTEDITEAKVWKTTTLQRDVIKCKMRAAKSARVRDADAVQSPQIEKDIVHIAT